MSVGKIRTALAVFALTAMVGCSTTSEEFGSSVRNAGSAISSNASDTSIHLALQRDMGREFPRYFAEMATEVHEGRVLIVGTTRTPQDRVRASQVAWQIEGVEEVVNELQVDEEQGAMAYLRDVRISSQLRARLLTAVDVSDSNFDFETVNSVVYILGVARDRSELEYVAELAATIAGVERVVSHALLAGDPRRQRRRAASVRS
jgi:osmotically-inducible protein OsmY